ncbi:hypothetical protein [Roseateles sp.]|uniref:hypothetical protein n=1 Tax=Roseateles sp. TaxID=1971397 RepID=UPI0039ED8362
MITSQEPGFVSGRVQPVLLPLGQFGEVVCIAVVGEATGHGFWARAVAAKPFSCLPGDLGHALFSFGSLVSADFVDWCTKGRGLESWRPPLGGLATGDWTEVSGFDFDDFVRVSMSLAGFGPVVSEPGGKPEQSNLAPRTSEESRFLEAVRAEVARTRPGFNKGFRKTLSLTGKAVSGEIDFVGHHYVTCYAAVNPKGRASTRVQTASAALWRLARARDAFGFAAPSAIELTAWVPPRGMPIYSNADYLVVDETIAELRAQAQREELEVFSVFDAPMACQRLVDLETAVTQQ